MEPGILPYGSNLDEEQKVFRTGAIRERRKSRLSGYRFAFNKRGRSGTCFANIMPETDSEVWGVAYLCDENAMTEMDGYEGVPSGHYRRE